jgi:hypothetical protein
LPADTSTQWFQRWITTGDAVCFVSGRPRFIKGDGGESPSWSGRFPYVMAAWSAEPAQALRASGLGWCP